MDLHRFDRGGECGIYFNKKESRNAWTRCEKESGIGVACNYGWSLKNAEEIEVGLASASMRAGKQDTTCLEQINSRAKQLPLKMSGM